MTLVISAAEAIGVEVDGRLLFAVDLSGGSCHRCLLSLIRADALETLQSDVARWLGEQNKKLRKETEL